MRYIWMVSFLMLACGESNKGQVAIDMTSEGASALTAESDTESTATLAAAIVTISEVYLQGDSRVTLRSDAFTTDLTALANTAAELVAAAEVEAGAYHQLRLVIEGAYIEVVGESQNEIWATANYDQVPEGATIAGELKMPSASSSGFKVKLGEAGLTVNEGEDAELLIDFDLSESLGHEAGASGQWIMEPVLTAYSVEATATIRVEVAADESVEASTAQTLEAELRDADGDFEARIQLTAEGGVYTGTFLFLDPSEGPFELRLLADGELNTSLEMPTEVSVSAGVEAQVHVDVSAG